VDGPQQTVQSILINSVLTIVDCLVVGLGNVTVAKSSRALVPWKVHTTYFLLAEASTKA
jgi:hypothetical protein